MDCCRRRDQYYSPVALVVVDVDVVDDHRHVSPVPLLLAVQANAPVSNVK